MSLFRDRRRRADAAALRRAVTRVGESLFVEGSPTIVEWFGGHIEIGDRFSLASRPVPSHMYCAGLLRIGDDVSIGHGAGIAATQQVTIGDRTRIGAFLVLMDTDFHGERAKTGARATTNTSISSASGYGPVTIGADVRIGHQVTILRGSTIGDRATIAPGSVVNGRIPPDVVAAGVPARVITDADFGQPTDTTTVDVAQIVATTFALPRRPDLHEGPTEISEWDSLGALKLLLALEEAIGRPLDTNALANAKTIADVQRVINQWT